MNRNEEAIFTNMCMIYDGDYILVQDRCSADWPGVTFPGGHVEHGESFVESVNVKCLKKPDSLLRILLYAE